MKFRIRFADQIVGLFIILAALSVVVVVVMLGKAQRWFAKDLSFHTEFSSAGGLSANMPVLFRGFTIGNVESFSLNSSNNVDVIFTIYEQYQDRVKEGSLVEVMISPVGLGNQFLFHTGKGLGLLKDGDFIPSVGSPAGEKLVREGLAEEPQHDDSISLLLNRVSSVMNEVNKALVTVNEALTSGSQNTNAGRIVGNVDKTVQGLSTLPATVDRTAGSLESSVRSLLQDIDDLKAMLQGELDRINPILADVTAITDKAASPGGMIDTVLDSSGPVYTNLVSSLNSISAILKNLDRTVEFIPGQLPQLAGIITDLRATLATAEDVLVALTNNPLLRKGIPERVEAQSSGTSPRDVAF
jgi:phospholipid/cholesterol/gamma-HCH transport system substrate-binding protein